MSRRFCFGWIAVITVISSLVDARRVEALDPGRAITQYVLESWTARDNAPVGTITGIAQTSNGYLWLGTESEGLLRFDGVTFVRTDDLDRLFGRRVDRITSLMCDSNGTLWIGTNFGLARFNQGQWKTFDRGESKDVFGLYEAPDGAVWYARHWEGLYRIAGDRLTSLPLAGKPRMVTVDARGALWAGGYEGLWRLAGKERRLFTMEDGLAARNVTQIFCDKSGNVWVGCPVGLMLLRHDKIIGRFTTRDGLSSDDVSAIYADRDGSLWVGTANGGLNRRRGERFESLTKASGLMNNRVTAIYEDREGSLWIGTGGGLNRLHDASLLPFGDSEGLSPRVPLAIVADRDGSVFVAFGFDGLNQIKNGQISIFPIDAAARGIEWDGPLFADPDGGVWSGRGNGSLCYQRNGRRTLYRIGRQVACVNRDGRSLVFASSTGEVFRLVNGKAERFRLADGSLLGPETLGFDYVWMMHFSRDGTLWLATTRGAIAVRNGRARQVWHEGTLSARSVLEDEEGTIWLGTMAGIVRVAGESVSNFTTNEGLPQDDIFHVLSDRQGGLWMSCAHGIFRVKRQELENVAQHKARLFTVEMFGASDGMRTTQATSAYQPAGCATPDGRLWFVTTKGVVVVDPTRIRRNTLPPPVVVEAVLADGKPLALGTPTGVPAGTQRLAIHYNGLSLLVPQRVRFKYKLEGYDPQWVDGEGRRVAYYTKLPPGMYGFRVIAANNDGLWNDAGASLEIRQLPRFYQTIWFMALAAMAATGGLFSGHRWRVAALRARERELTQRVEQRTAELQRETAEHKRTAHWLATERQLHQAALTREVLAEERTRMARELHDSLAQNFAGLSLQLESVAVDLPADAAASRASLDVAARMLRHAQAEARRAVWDLRSPVGESTSLKQALERTVAPLRRGPNPRIEVHVDPEDAELGPQTQRQVLRIADEAITNAVTHGCASLVSVSCRVQSSEVRLEVRDDGQGFAYLGGEAVEVGHFGLLGMGERARKLGGKIEIESRCGEGTCVRLRCPRTRPEPGTAGRLS